MFASIKLSFLMLCKLTLNLSVGQKLAVPARLFPMLVLAGYEELCLVTVIPCATHPQTSAFLEIFASIVWREIQNTFPIHQDFLLQEIERLQTNLRLS